MYNVVEETGPIESFNRDRLFECGGVDKNNKLLFNINSAVFYL